MEGKENFGHTSDKIPKQYQKLFTSKGLKTQMKWVFEMPKYPSHGYLEPVK